MADPVVELQSGLARDVIEKHEDGFDFYAFRGIPYDGETPVGELRFKMKQFGERMELVIWDNMPDPVLTLHDQAVEYLRQDDYYPAMTFSLSEPEYLKRSLGDDYERYAIPILRTIYANVRFAMRDYTVAAEVLSEVLSCQEETWGKKHMILGATLNNLAVVWAKQGKDEDVEKLAKRVLDIYDQPTSHDHKALYEKLMELSFYFDEHDKYKEAERCCSRALKVCEANLRPDDSLIDVASNALALCYLKLGRIKGAEGVFKKVLSRAYEKESGGVDNKPMWLKILTPKKMLRITKDSNKRFNVWQIAEQNERNKTKLYEEADPPVWYKPANFDSPPFKAALNGLEWTYEKQDKYIAAETLRHFSNQQCTETATGGNNQHSNDLSTPRQGTVASMTDEGTSSSVFDPSELSPPLTPKVRGRLRSSLYILLPPPSPSLSAKTGGLSTTRRIPTPPPLPAPSCSPLIPSRGDGSLWNISPRTLRLPKTTTEQMQFLEQAIADLYLQAEIPAPPPLPSPPPSPIQRARGHGPHRWSVSQMRIPRAVRPPTPPPLPSPPLPTRRKGPGWNISRNTPLTPHLPPVKGRESSYENNSQRFVVLPSAPPTEEDDSYFETPFEQSSKTVSEETRSLERIISQLQAEIAEKAQRLAQAERTIETHGAFCCICLDEVANRMWSSCNHLTACGECVEVLLRMEENRGVDGIACPKCRTHGRILPAFI